MRHFQLYPERLCTSVMVDADASAAVTHVPRTTAVRPEGCVGTRPSRQPRRVVREFHVLHCDARVYLLLPPLPETASLPRHSTRGARSQCKCLDLCGNGQPAKGAVVSRTWPADCGPSRARAPRQTHRRQLRGTGHTLWPSPLGVGDQGTVDAEEGRAFVGT